MARLRATVVIVALLLVTPASATADVVLEWDGIAVRAFIANGQSPFAQARYMAITQLAVFEAVNAITHVYEPYLGTVVAPAGARADAAAVAAAYAVLTNYFPLTPGLDDAYVASLAAIEDGSAKSNGIAVGRAAAAQMIALRVADGSAPPEFHVPASTEPGVWQPTPSCSPSGGGFLQWQNVVPFGIPTVFGNTPWIKWFRPDPPVPLDRGRYTKSYNEVKRVGSVDSTSTDRPLDRANVARFYAASSPSFVFNMVAAQVAAAQGRSLSHNARALALINMAINDSLVASFGAKYFYNLWRPETAIRAGDMDGNPKTDPDPTFAPFISTPCFPSYPSNHGSGSSAGSEMLRRLYGARGHSLTLENPAVPGVTLHYTKFDQITDDVDDARVYGGIHFRFDQEAGTRLGRDIAVYVYRTNLKNSDN